MIWTKDFSLRLAASRVRASNAETIEEIINGESAELSDANVKSLFNQRTRNTQGGPTRFYPGN